MNDHHNDENWFQDIVQLREGYDVEAVQRFSDRLLRLASSKLPEQLQRRVDPEDIVQSVFRSFFARHEAGKFQFEEVADIWRLLAAMTYHKVQHSIRHHGRQQRDVNREIPNDKTAKPLADVAPTASSIVMMMELLDQILETLSPAHREMVRMRLEGYSIEEISEKAKVSTRTVLRTLKLVRKVAFEIGERQDR